MLLWWIYCLTNWYEFSWWGNHYHCRITICLGRCWLGSRPHYIEVNNSGKAIWPHNEEGLENLARYIIRASFSQERITYVAANDSSDGVAKVIYQSKDGTSTKTFDALDWLAQLVTHIPNKGEQMVRYYGFYLNKSRGLRKKAGTDDQVPALIDSDISPQAFRKNWARLIQKILKHPDLWDVKRKPPPCANGPPPEAFIIYDQS
jgi:hypothetical protein